MKESITDLIVKIPMFAGLNPDELAIVEKRIKLFEIEQGKTLFKEGEQGDYVCFVLDGRLDVTIKTVTGDDFVLNTLQMNTSGA
ncbi:MAG: cyclic nucleotide-binding domain-containing protein [Pseudomonadota bacterium]|uniref:Cyclic nucleotide-binding domain-containing protein n=1 Tax=Candidatus Desulfatibia profunda TaxID=2841695 RepID=A0A8J6NS89_9BACT|nr:hypothetical protein [Candidatus Desulfatibia profunda]MBL7178703.1 hypothetical protein [Desulfobacterales bacterium]